MRKQVFGRRFKRDKNQRKALFSGLISSMIIKGRIETTEEKAKAIKGEIEKIVTKAKKGNKKLLIKRLNPFEIEKMLNEIAPTFANRPGGYVRIIKTGRRLSDNASMAIVEWTEQIPRQIKNEKLKMKNGKHKSPKGSKVTKSSKSKKSADKSVRKVAKKAASPKRPLARKGKSK